MIVPSIGAARRAVETEATDDTNQASINYDSFLKLLIASMKNQDPTQPNDPAQTLSQLASFSSVEQGIKLNDKLESLISISSAGQAAALLGKTVSSLDGSISGIAKSVEMTSSGLVVILEDGKRLSVAVGLKIG